MAFINELIPRDDVTKYGIKEVDRTFSKFTYEPEWTVDRERDIFLRDLVSGREEGANRSTMAFYWKGLQIIVTLDLNVDDSANGERTATYSLVIFELPTDLLEKRHEILADLRDALIARKTQGVSTSRPMSKCTFNF